MPFHILVDYDNLRAADTNKGLEYVVEKIVAQFSKNEIQEKNATIRLYGGWYENNNITRRAQDIQIEIHSHYPKTLVLNDLSTKLIVNVELAMSLSIEPTKQLFNTYRIRGYPSGIQSKYTKQMQGCTGLNCPLSHVHDFISNDICQQCNIVTPKDILFKPEQKLVDTMLTADMITISINKISLSIVSSDDDFWPGILTAITLGSVIYHILPKPYKTNPHYLNTVSRNYSQKYLPQ